jgi:predicted nucleic acid-binding protein
VTSSAVVDNDVLQKLTLYGLIAELRGVLANVGEIGILGAARFMVRRAIARSSGDAKAKLSSEFEEFLEVVINLEPTEEEIDLATRMEEFANREALGFDAGESQLCAIAIVRGIASVVTGDKRAIGAAEAMLELEPALAELSGRLVCLEQLMLGIIRQVGVAQVRSNVCALKAIDTALSICLKCWHPGTPNDLEIVDAFKSYINDLRSKAPNLLCAGYSFPNS